ncbi:MAG: hypothetical protein II331_05685, partial [Lachnospiraceae bacterium]|nr:hypothetical protein [Lachnospiraceae bacterium]
MKNGLLKYAFFKDSQIKGGSFVKIIMKTVKMKLSLHEFSFVKATAPFISSSILKSLTID